MNGARVLTMSIQRNSGRASTAHRSATGLICKSDHTSELSAPRLPNERPDRLNALLNSDTPTKPTLSRPVACSHSPPGRASRNHPVDPIHPAVDPANRIPIRACRSPAQTPSVCHLTISISPRHLHSMVPAGRADSLYGTIERWTTFGCSVRHQRRMPTYLSWPPLCPLMQRGMQ